MTLADHLPGSTNSSSFSDPPSTALVLVFHHLLPVFGRKKLLPTSMSPHRRSYKAFHKSGVLPRDNAVTKITEASQVGVELRLEDDVMSDNVINP